MRLQATFGSGSLIFIFCFLFLVNFVPAAHAQGNIVHFPVNSAIQGEDIFIEAKVEGTSARVLFIKVYYKLSEEESFREADLTPDINRWVGAIPGSTVQGERMFYFISALLDNQSIITYPAYNPYNEPVEVILTPPAVTERDTTKTQEQFDLFVPDDSIDTFVPESTVPSSKETSSQSPIFVISPEKNENLVSEEVYFAASFEGTSIQVDSSTVQIFLDGRNVTPRSEISQFMATFEPAKLPPGPHWFKIVAKDQNGKILPPNIINFKVIGEQKDKVVSEFRGHVFTDFRQENISDNNESLTMAGGDITGRYGALQYDAGVFLTSLEDKKYQPRNRFHFSLNTKILGMTAGDVYPRYNDLILYGKRVRGFSGYLKLGFFNLETTIGATNRSVSSSYVPATDSTSMAITKYGTFQQNLFAIRPSFGSGRNFQLGFSLVKVKDDTGSIKYGSMPKDNLVLGPDLKISFDRGRFVFYADGAFSMLTNNIYPGSLTEEEIEEAFDKDVDLPFDPKDFEKYLIINDSTVPLDPTDKTSMAYHLRLKLNYFRNLFRIGYKSIGAEYSSLANYWLRTDLRGFYFSDRMRLFRNKLYLTLGYEGYKDNFSQNDNNPSTDLKTVNYAVSYYPGRGLPRINISLRNYYRDNQVDTLRAVQSFDITGAPDSLYYYDYREKSMNKDLTFQIGYDINVFDADHSINLSYITSDKKDDYNASRDAKQELSSNMHMLSLATKYNIPLKTTITYASNDNSYSGGVSDFEFSIFGLGAEYRHFNNKLVSFAEMRFTNATGSTMGSSVLDYSRNHFRIGGSYYISPRHYVTLDVNFISYNDKTSTTTASNSSYTDQIIRLRYEKFF